MVGTHGEKLKEHRARIDEHKMYLMHIAQEADLVKHSEDQVWAARTRAVGAGVRVTSEMQADQWSVVVIASCCACPAADCPHELHMS